VIEPNPQKQIKDEHIKCPKCDYDLYGLQELRCPECGFHFTISALKTMMAVSEGQRLASAQMVICLAAFATAIGVFVVAKGLAVPLVALILLGAAGYTWAFVTWVEVTDRYYGSEALPELLKLYICAGSIGGLVLIRFPQLMLWIMTGLCIAAWIVFIYSWPKLPERDKPRHQDFNRHVHRYSRYAVGLITFATILTFLAWALTT